MTPLAPEPKVERVTSTETRRLFGKVGGALLAGTLLIGAMHMPFARSLLMKVGGCPYAASRMTAVEMDNARRLGADSMAQARGTVRAGARPAFEFALEKSSESDVLVWASKNGVQCAAVHAGLLRCNDVSPLALGRPEKEGAVDELMLGFDVHSELVNVTTLRTHLRAEAAADAAREILSSLDRELGEQGESAAFSPEHLSNHGAASIASRSYRYADYTADVVAMNVPGDGLALREHYMAPLRSE